MPEPRTAPRPAERLECVRPGTRDAGEASPTRSDPRTLVLRLRDLPRGFGFAVGYQEGGVALLPLTEVGDELGAAVDAAGAELSAARGTFGRGRMTPPPQEPGAPPPPPSCPDPETEVAAAAVVASSPAGARRLYGLSSSLAGSMIGTSAPVGVRERTSPSPVAVGEEAQMIEHQAFPRELTTRMIAWRDGRIVSIVRVLGAGGRADVELLVRLAKRQARYVHAAH